MDQPEFPMRINKYLAFKNYATRKGADTLIEQGKVFVNGRLAVLGDKINRTDTVEVRRSKAPSHAYFAYHKPVGTVTHSPQKGEKDIRESIPLKGVFPIGRLDKDSHGLIILTDDGRVTDRLLGPERANEKEYVVKTVERLPRAFEERMSKGIGIDGYTTKPCVVRHLDSRAFSIILTEGKNRQIRRMCEALGVRVAELERVRIMNVPLGNLAPGAYRRLGGKELKTFLGGLGL
jgi:23S rRNA pseudouridine2604 synthase